MSQFEGKVLAITGAANGIGAATARLAALRGASVSLCDIDEKALSIVADELRSKGCNVLTRRVDISNSASVDAWIADTIAHFGELDCAANVAGVEGLPGGKVFIDIVDMTDEHWNHVLGINLTGLFYCLRAQLRVMGEGGSIMNVSSVAGVVGRPSIAAYSSSKHGIVGLTRTAAKEVGSRGIRVNALAPGPIMTPLYERWRRNGQQEGELPGTSASLLPLQRVGTAEEMARMICFALSEDAAFTTGAVFSADGGFAC